MIAQLIETAYHDGRKVYRRVEGRDREARKYAREMAARFARKSHVADVRVFEADTADLPAREAGKAAP